MEAQRWEREGSHIGGGGALEVRDGGQARRMKADEPSWKGLAQSRPRFGDGCMEVQLDMSGGVTVKVASLYDISVMG